ncbi:MAG TPA: tetratricopeptide repeat protein [Lacunisphaera sp.]|nr:tetratricopeptide repeat protein [Lacunisphaera sp.]
MPRPSASRPAPTASPRAAATGWPEYWMWVLVFAAVLLAYFPAMHAEFIWDDDGHVTRTDLRSLGGLVRIWFEIGATQQYYPLLHSAFWLEHLLWGDLPFGYHLVNILLHATAACLFGRLLARLGVPGAWLAALLFALHPVCVESVAWISEQKNTLSAVFYLLGALAYLDFDRERRARCYVVASAWFACALLTKTVTASLPAALLVVCWWQRGRLDWRRDLRPLLPWFVLGAASGLLTAHFERVLIGAQGEDFGLGMLQRCLLAGRVVWFYLGKLAWPVHLMFVYPRWTIDASSPGTWLFLLATLALLAGLAWWSRRSRAPLAAALLFGGTLFPVLGFVNVFPFVFSYVADHFQYLASLPVFALLAAGVARISGRLPVMARVPAAVGVLALLGGLSSARCLVYRDQETLFRTTLSQNPDAWLAYHNLALIYAESGRVADALPLVQRVLQLRPNYPLAENNLGDDLTKLGRPQEAVPHLERAIQLEPRYYQAYNNLGVALMQAGRPQDGLARFESALKLQPDFPEAEHNLGLALMQLDRAAEAVPHFAQAARLRPDYAAAEMGWGIALTLTAGLDAGRPHFERAIALAPENPEYPGTYARALTQAGRLEEAATQLAAVVRMLPDNAEAHLDLARVLRRLGRNADATRELQAASRLSPALPNQRP